MLDIKKLLRSGPVILDGAAGTNFQKKGMPMGICPEQWVIDNKEIVIELQRGYAEAGSHIVYAPTFTANQIKLAEYHLGDRVAEINKAVVAITREAVQGMSYVAGNLTMTGRQLKPIGDLDFEDLVECYKEQVRALDEAGVDCIAIETMMDVGEARAALLAVKETTNLPVLVSMTFEATGKTLFGTTPVTALITLQAMGADVVGINCSTGPDMLLDIVKELSQYATVPIMVKPNAGLPKLITGETVFDMDKETFAGHMKALVEAGASVVGGCCGTNPEYIRLLAQSVQGMKTVQPRTGSIRAVTNARACKFLPLDGEFTVVGERINPTGKKMLREQLKAGNFEIVQDMAVSQVEAGAGILDINVGMSGVDERRLMLEVIDQVNEVVDVPFCLDSSSVAVLEAALRRYHGRALVNSVSCEKKKLDDLLPIVKKYGAMFILLPLTDEGLPKDLEERKANIRTVMERAFSLGFAKEDIVVDGLVATIGADKAAAVNTLETIRYCCHELELATICGLSNISFGLPDRIYVNSTFLTLGIQNGLTMAIANPSQEQLMRMAFAADLLMNKEESDLRYIEQSQRYQEQKESETISNTAPSENSENPGTTAAVSQESSTEAILSDIRQDILKGKKKQVTSHIKAALTSGITASYLLNEVLIPAITTVGDLFNEQKYFLPQLIMSAEAMKIGVEHIEPLLSEGADSAKGPTVILATVKGDIHDIGKNLVVMMMKNYGYNVIDLGKDVPKETIIQSAIENNASIIGLSALMTTTMQEMREVVALARENNLPAKIIIGGAVITQDYADEIGADGFSEDAVGAVQLVEKLLAD